MDHPASIGTRWSTVWSTVASTAPEQLPERQLKSRPLGAATRYLAPQLALRDPLHCDSGLGWGMGGE
jgi:hypothetical protein